MSKRIRMQRTKGWRKPGNAVYVGRPSRWGNPFAVRAAGGAWRVDGTSEVFATEAEARALAVALFRSSIGTPGAVTCSEIEGRLNGLDLACWCPLDQPCHADVLLEIANAPVTRESYTFDDCRHRWPPPALQREADRLIALGRPLVYAVALIRRATGTDLRSAIDEARRRRVALTVNQFLDLRAHPTDPFATTAPND